MSMSTIAVCDGRAASIGATSLTLPVLRLMNCSTAYLYSLNTLVSKCMAIHQFPQVANLLFLGSSLALRTSAPDSHFTIGATGHYIAIWHPAYGPDGMTWMKQDRMQVCILWISGPDEAGNTPRQILLHISFDDQGNTHHSMILPAR